MQQKSHQSIRTQRRAAERAALKAARSSAPRFLAVQPGKTLTATAVGHLNEPASSEENQINQTTPFKLSDNHNTSRSSDSQTQEGPQPLTGKDASSRNAIRHGLCAVKTLILPTESRAEYMQLETRWLQTYRIDPHTAADPVKAEIARTAARAEWFYLRAERNYSDTEAKLLTENPDMSTWTDDQHKQLSRVLRYRTANANILNKHRKELEAHIKARAAESTHYQKLQHNDEKMAITRERLEVFRQKNKPFDLAEELEAMKQKAIRLGFRQPDPESEDGQPADN